MRETSADILEFESLRELLGRYISSQLGRRELERLQPISDRAVLERLLAETAEAIEYVRAAARPQPASREAAIRVRFTSIPDVAEAAGKLRIEGAALEPREIYDLLRFLDQAGEARSVITAVGERFPLLNARAANIADFNAVIRDLGGKVLADGSVADDASVALYRLRRDIDRQQREIQASLERFLRAHREEGTLQ